VARTLALLLTPSESTSNSRPSSSQTTCAARTYPRPTSPYPPLFYLISPHGPGLRPSEVRFLRIPSQCCSAFARCTVAFKPASTPAVLVEMDSFPGPVLAVAADVVKHVDGDDSLPILWTSLCFFRSQAVKSASHPLPPVFTKCKESLQDGRRLENISWRLWYQSMVAANLSPSSDLLETPPDAYPFVLNEKPYRPLTPDELPRRTFTTDPTSNVPLSSHGETFF
jgi:hypothetical protein